MGRFASVASCQCRQPQVQPAVRDAIDVQERHALTRGLEQGALKQVLKPRRSFIGMEGPATA